MKEHKTILVVDDNTVNRKLINVFLRGRPFKIVEMEDGPQALAYLAGGPVELMLLDISMPMMSGIEVCRIIRQNEGLAAMPVVAYTAHAMPHEKQNFLEEGFNDVLIKPITRDQLEEVIREYLQV